MSNYLSNNYGVTPFSTWTGFISSYIEYIESSTYSTVTSTLTVNGSNTRSTVCSILSLEFDDEEEYGHTIGGSLGGIIDLSFIYRYIFYIFPFPIVTRKRQNTNSDKNWFFVIF